MDTLTPRRRGCDAFNHPPESRLLVLVLPALVHLPSGHGDPAGQGANTTGLWSSAKWALRGLHKLSGIKGFTQFNKQQTGSYPLKTHQKGSNYLGASIKRSSII